jgi:16S rRNA G966 N2-methylase RsmD
MAYRSLFSMYGGKGAVVHRYPAPLHPVIVEPFAGAAAYSLRHGLDKKCVLFDADRRMARLWQFLLTKNALPAAEAVIPDTIKVGANVLDLTKGLRDFLAEQATWDVDPLQVEKFIEGLEELLMAQANIGTQGALGRHTQVTEFAADQWHRIKKRLRCFLPRMREWEFYEADYSAADRGFPRITPHTTWFIDPPYNNSAGSRYRAKVKDYRALANWIQRLPGQVIVCENAGADWLPFRRLARGARVRARNRKDHEEAIYYQIDGVEC